MSIKERIGKISFPANAQFSCSVFKKIGIDAILICFLALAVIKITYAIENVVEVCLEDESFSMHEGIALKERGIFYIDANDTKTPNSSLYSIWYCLLSLLEKSSLQLYYLNYKVLLFCITILFYVYLRRTKVIRVVSVSASFLFLISIVTVGWPWSVHFALLILLLFLILATFAKSEIGYYFIVGYGTIIVSFVRFEYFISFIIFCAVLLFFVLPKQKRDSRSFKKDLINLAIFLFVSLVFVHIFGDPLSRHKSWTSFCDGFSAKFAAKNNITYFPGEASQIILMQSVFGNADSIISAAWNNSREFFHYILSNATIYIRTLLGFFVIKLDESLPPLLNISVVILQVILFPVATIYLFKKISKILKSSNDPMINRLYIVSLVLCIPGLIGALIIYPKRHILIIQVAMIMVLLSYFISKVVCQEGKEKVGLLRPLFLGILILFLTPNLGKEQGFSTSVGIFRASFPGIDLTKLAWAAPSLPLSNRYSIEFLQSLNIAEQVNMLTIWGSCDVYLGKNYNNIHLYKMRDISLQTHNTLLKVPFSSFLRDNKINIIVVDEVMKNYIYFIDDSEAKAFLENPEVEDFFRLNIPKTRRYLLIKKDLFKKINL